jgi:hypothetical protein
VTGRTRSATGKAGWRWWHSNVSTALYNWERKAWIRHIYPIPFTFDVLWRALTGIKSIYDGFHRSTFIYPHASGLAKTTRSQRSIVWFNDYSYPLMTAYFHVHVVGTFKCVILPIQHEHCPHRQFLSVPLVVCRLRIFIGLLSCSARRLLTNALPQKMDCFASCYFKNLLCGQYMVCLCAVFKLVQYQDHVQPHTRNVHSLHKNF